MYRGLDSAGNLQGGPMYVIREACQELYRSRFYFPLPPYRHFTMFQANQLTALIGQTVLMAHRRRGLVSHGPRSRCVGRHGYFRGLPRCDGAVRSLPAMVIVYVTMTLTSC